MSGRVGAEKVTPTTGDGGSPPRGGASPGSPAPLDACEPGHHPPPISTGARGPAISLQPRPAFFWVGEAETGLPFLLSVSLCPLSPGPFQAGPPTHPRTPRYLRWDLQRRGTGAERAEPQAEVRGRLGCPSGDLPEWGQRPTPQL